MRRFLPLVPLLAVWFTAVPPVSGQAAPAVPAAGGEAAPAAETARTVAPERATARATMRTFLEAVNAAAEGDPRWDDAVACLDFGTVNENVRRVTGHRLVVDLKEIIDRTRFVNYDEIPDLADAGPYVFWRSDTGEIVIDRGSDGEWRFTRGTLDSVPALLREAMQRDRVAGVPEAPAVDSAADWFRNRLPESWRGGGFLLENWQWLVLLLLIFVGVVVDRVVVMVVAGAARGIFVRLLPGGDPDVVPTAVRPSGIFAMAGVWWFGLLSAGLPIAVLNVLLIAVKFLLAVSAVWMAYRLTDIVGEFFADRAGETESKFDDLLVPLVRKTLKVFIVAFGLVFIADNLNVDISSLLAGLGLGGLAFALAAQDTVKNLFGSLTVLLDKPFAVGDWVVIGGDAEGTVEEVGFRSTRIRTFYNSVITVPNANLISTAVDNLGARTYRRWKTTLALTYDTPPEKIEEFCEGVRELVRLHPSTRKDYFHVYANEYGAASLDVLLYIFFRTPDWGAELAARHDLFLDILRLAHDVGVEFAFPTQTLHVHANEWSPAPWSGAPDAETAARKDGRSKAKAITDRKS